MAQSSPSLSEGPEGPNEAGVATAFRDCKATRDTHDVHGAKYG